MNLYRTARYFLSENKKNRRKTKTLHCPSASARKLCPFRFIERGIAQNDKHLYPKATPYRTSRMAFAKPHCNNRRNIALLHKDELHYVRTHSESFQMLFVRVVMHRGILPAVSKVAFVGIETHQTPLVYQTVALGRL